LRINAALSNAETLVKGIVFIDSYGTIAAMNIDFMFFDAGGGHRAAAEALREAIAEQRPEWQVRLVNLQEILDRLDPVHRLTGIRMQDVYNSMLRSGWTLGAGAILPLLHGVVCALHPRAVRLLADFWREAPPDLVLSLVPNFNRALREGLAKAAPGVPYVTLLTDVADYPPHFWIEKQEQFFICGSARAVEQAREIGHPPERIFQTSGMVLHPRFHAYPEVDPDLDPDVDRAAERRLLGLDPDRLTGLVLFGGQGSRKIVEIAQRLNESDLPIQMVFICGKNESVVRALRRRKFRMPVYIGGFTHEVPRFMRLSDFFIGKPGPGSISEALAMGLPVIVENNAWTLPQERYNAQWVTETGTGVAVPDFRKIGEAVAHLLEPQSFTRYRRNAAALNNRAVFEVAEILERIAMEPAHVVLSEPSAVADGSPLRRNGPIRYRGRF
jgi:1,2-diacylglycerol 3-beta-galactosyltransferase